MPVTAKLSRAFYDRFGDELTNELVEWLNQVDTALSPRVPRPLGDQLRTIRREAGTADRGAQRRAAGGDGRAAERTPERASERLGGRRGPAAGPHRRGPRPGRAP